MGMMDEFSAYLVANQGCPICASKLKKGPKYLEQKKAIILRRQLPVDQKIWESLWDLFFGILSLGSVPNYGTQFRKVRFICPQCKRQFVMLENKKFTETTYSKYFRIF